MIQLKNSEQIKAMMAAGRITGEALLRARDAVRPGISTWELDRIVRESIERAGAKPSFLGYGGFPGSACISINDEVIHGIPSHTRILQEGDRSTSAPSTRAFTATPPARFPLGASARRHSGSSRLHVTASSPGWLSSGWETGWATSAPQSTDWSCKTAIPRSSAMWGTG